MSKRKAANLANGANGNPMISTHNKDTKNQRDKQIPEDRCGPLNEVANRLLLADLLSDQPNVKHGPFRHLYFDPCEGEIMLFGKRRARNEYVTVPPGSLSTMAELVIRFDIKKIKIRGGLDCFPSPRFPDYCKERVIKLCAV